MREIKDIMIGKCEFRISQTAPRFPSFLENADSTSIQAYFLLPCGEIAVHPTRPAGPGKMRKRQKTQNIQKRN